MKIAVVILNYNGEKHLRQFLPSVMENSLLAEIWVADNASTDHSLNFLEDYKPRIHLLNLETNTGYAGGYNRALTQIDADVYVLLNSDVEVTPGWLQSIEHKFENDSNLAAIQPKIKSFTKKEYFEYAGAAGGYVDKWGYPFCRGRVFDTCEKDEGQYDDQVSISWASGACLFIRADVFHELEGFDERFFAHMEEIDLCWRIKNAGYDIIYDPGSVVYHLGGGTLNKSNPRKTFLNFRNGLAILVKNLPFQSMLVKVPVRLILDGVSALKFLLDGNEKDVLAILKAHFAFYAMLPYLLKKRTGKVNQNRFMSNYSIVWQYFAKKKKKFSEMPHA
ncbi:glycosyltransferase family 2 protein [Jiulongibacter sp. NS-SX5]|uniref:glycosyltransferase family 2 protein n=1 Tax=Jiulongibacter sp. NS-SX5 TaxID=3463854 RepID=UPI0040590A54